MTPATDPAVLPELWNNASSPPSSVDLRRALIMGSGLLAVLFLMSALVPIGGAVLGTGKIGVESHVKRISHPFGGVIAEIAVGNGEHVRQGQLLLRFDDKVSGANAAYSTLTVEQLFAQRARLEAERIGAVAIVFPPELTRANSDNARKAMSDEQRLFDLRRAEETQLQAQIAAKIVQLNAELSGIQAQIVAFRKQRVLIEPERAGIRELWEKDLVTINRLNQMERTAVEIDGQLAVLDAQVAQTRSRIIEAREQRIQLGQSRRVEASAELARVIAAFNDQSSRSVAAGDQYFRSEIRAPYAGTVEKVAFTTVGEVVRPAEPIMEIVPDTDRMVVEASISPTDIDQVRQGQKAFIRFSAFNVATTPEIEGRVIYVATDRSDIPETREAFYRVRIAIDQAQLRRERLELRSGMPAEVNIETGRRSMLSYLTKPLRDQFSRAFRDN